MNTVYIDAIASRKKTLFGRDKEDKQYVKDGYLIFSIEEVLN